MELTADQRDDLNTLITSNMAALVDVRRDIEEYEAGHAAAQKRGDGTMMWWYSAHLAMLRRDVIEYERNIVRWSARLAADAG